MPAIAAGFAGPAIALAGIPAAASSAASARSTDHAIASHMGESTDRLAGLPRQWRIPGFPAVSAHPPGGPVMAVARAAPVGPGVTGPRRIARFYLVSRFHWPFWQFRYLRRLWENESGWNRYAANPYSGAYGIPQALPGSKMASAGPDWRTSARTQIRWGMSYIRARYGTPYLAWRHERHLGWY